MGYIRLIGKRVTTGKPSALATSWRLRDNSPFWRDFVVPELGKFFAEKFRRNGADWAGSPRWRPLASSTLKKRRRPGHGRGGILWDTGRLRDAWSVPYGPNNIVAVTKTGVEYGANVKVGGRIVRRRGRRKPTMGALYDLSALHQYGARRRKWRLVRRPIVPTGAALRRLASFVGANYKQWVLTGKMGRG